MKESEQVGFGRSPAFAALSLVARGTPMWRYGRREMRGRGHGEGSFGEGTGLKGQGAILSVWVIWGGGIWASDGLVLIAPCVPCALRELPLSFALGRPRIRAAGD